MPRTIMRMPALAVVGADHQIVRSTESFRRKYEQAAELCERAPELDLVLNGQRNAAVVDLGGFSVAIEAVTDDTGERQAVLTLPPDDLPSDAESAMATLRDAADDSEALVWVKDLDGRYLYVNPRLESVLNTSGEKLNGKTDAELPPVETVDGPRLNYARDGIQEPLQLEYIVPAFEGRPAMAAFRFPLRDEDGHPIATCGVASLNVESHVARDEAVRLMELERWSRLDPLDLRAELLEQWHVHAASAPENELLLPAFDVKRPPQRDVATRPPRETQAATSADAPVHEVEVPAVEVPEDEGREVEVCEVEVREEPALEFLGPSTEDEWVRQLREAASIAAPEFDTPIADALASDLQLARKWSERAEQLEVELEQARVALNQVREQTQTASAQAQPAHDELEGARAQADQAWAQADEARAQAEQARAQAEQARAEAEQARREAEQARAEAERAAEEADRRRDELEQARLELEQEQAARAEERSQTESARADLLSARAELESLRNPAIRLSEELQQTLTAERERADELAETVARIRSRLAALEPGVIPAGAAEAAASSATAATAVSSA